MPFIHGVFLVNFGQPPLIVINFLPESQRCFFGIHFLEVTGKPAGTPRNVKPVTPPTACNRTSRMSRWMADRRRMNKTERIFKIEQLIAARKLVSFQTLQDELEVSRATLKRDLEYLRSRMKTPIVYDRDANGYRLGGKRGETARVEFPGMWFNASEAAALLTMQHLLSDLQPGLLARHVEPLLERLKSLLESADHSFSEIQRRVRIIHLGRRAPQPKFFETAAAALLNRRQLQIGYYSRASNETTTRGLAAAPRVLPRKLVSRRLVSSAQGHTQLRRRWHPAG